MSRWEEPATSAQRAYVAGLARDRDVPAALLGRVEAAVARGLTKRDAFDLIPLLRECRADHESSRGDTDFRGPGPVTAVGTRSALVGPYEAPFDPDDVYEHDEASREFTFQMYEANGEEYPGQMEESLGTDWLHRREHGDHRS